MSSYRLPSRSRACSSSRETSKRPCVRSCCVIPSMNCTASTNRLASDYRLLDALRALRRLATDHPDAVWRVLQHELGGVIQTQLPGARETVGQAKDDERTLVDIALI